MKRKTPLSQAYLDNRSCFTAEQIEKIESMEPYHGNRHTKARYGLLAEATDYRKSGMELFKTKG